MDASCTETIRGATSTLGDASQDLTSTLWLEALKQLTPLQMSSTIVACRKNVLGDIIFVIQIIIFLLFTHDEFLLLLTPNLDVHVEEIGSIQ